jgi:hypothetical protein
MIFDFVEGHVILSALWDYDEYFLPRFICRDFLYKLIKNFMDSMHIEYRENRIPRPDLYDELYDETKSFEINLSADELDVINRAVDAGSFKECTPAYPKHIQEAAGRIVLEMDEALGDKSYEMTPENRDIFYKVFFGKT